MYNVTVQNITGTRREQFSADSLPAAKRRAAGYLRSVVICYSLATISYAGGVASWTGSVSVGGNRVIWHAQPRAAA
jgi:hypothetical protein